MRTLLVLLLLAISLPATLAQSTTVFRGRPSIKISEAGISRVPEQLTREEAINVECVISKSGDDYYWATRENTPMVRIDSGGAFIIFVAATGAGYVKVINPKFKEAASLMSDTEARFDYVEHASLGLRTVTYYGKARP